MSATTFSESSLLIETKKNEESLQECVSLLESDSLVNITHQMMYLKEREADFRCHII